MARVEMLHHARSAARSGVPRRVAVLSVHTSPLDQPGTGDAGGMNVYILEVSRRLAECGVAVEIFTRATSGGLPPRVEVAPGVQVRHVTSGPLEPLPKEELPAQLCAFANGVLRAEAARSPGWYDLVHSHYWLSGQVGWLAKDRWGVPLVHTAHTLAKVKNSRLAGGDVPEPQARVVGEQQVVDEADRLVVNTPIEARELSELYAAPMGRVRVVTPGVDLNRFAPPAGDPGAARRVARLRLGLPPDRCTIGFVGRIQPLKGPDVLLRAVAELRDTHPDLADRLTVAVVGGNSGSGLDLAGLAGYLGVSDVVRFLPPRPPDALADVYHAADLIAVPSFNESFGLVALEAQACGTPVVAAAVGGLATAVQDGRSGLLVTGHDGRDWAAAIAGLLREPARCAQMSRAAVTHARRFSWSRSAADLLAVYRDAVTEHRTRVGLPLAVGGAS